MKTDSSGVLKIGNYIEAKIDVLKEGTIRFDSNKNVIIQIRLKSKDALFLDIGFENFKLSDNAKVYAYSINRKFIIGAFTHLNNRENLKFQTAAVKGEEIVFEFNCPENELKLNSVNISNITHYFKDWIGTSG